VFGQPAEAPREPTVAPKISSAPIPIPPAKAATAAEPQIHEAVAASVTIDELEQMAQANNPTLAQAAHRVEALQGEHLQVGLYPNPVIGYQAEEIGDSGSAGQHGMFFSQEIVTANKLGLNRAIVSHEVQQAEWEFEMQRRRVINAVRSRAYEVLAAQRTMELADELVKIGTAAADTAEKLFQARQVSQVDVLQARVEANTVRLQIVAARKAHESAWRQLATVVGVPEMEPAKLAEQLEDGLPERTWDTAVSELLGQSPQLARALAGVERARCAVARACAQRTPNIETNTSVRYNDNTDSTTVSLLVGVPLQIHNRNQGAILRAQSELAAAQHEVERVQLLLQNQLAEVFRDFDVAREQVDQYRREILPDAKRSLDLIRSGYQQGEFGYLQLLTAQQTYSRTNLSYVERLRDLRLRAVQIDGLLLTGGLEAPGP
jgi:cobalt-zinc-cadmium efflux system outer membrane protein